MEGATFLPFLTLTKAIISLKIITIQMDMQSTLFGKMTETALARLIKLHLSMELFISVIIRISMFYDFSP